MNNTFVPPRGISTVLGVDDIGSLLVRWDSGSLSNSIHGIDIIKKVDKNNRKLSFNKDCNFIG